MCGGLKNGKIELYNVQLKASERIGEPAAVMICHQRNLEKQVAWLGHLREISGMAGISASEITCFL